MLLPYLQMRHVERREFLAELRLEAEILCGDLQRDIDGVTIPPRAHPEVGQPQAILWSTYLLSRRCAHWRAISVNVLSPLSDQ